MSTKRSTRSKLVLAATALMVGVMPLEILGQIGQCDYDASAPTIAQAQHYFKLAQFDCAAKILRDKIRLDSASGQASAEVHGWLAITYCAMAQYDPQRYSAAFEQFLDALEANPNFTPEAMQEIPSVDSVYQAARDTLTARRERLRVSAQMEAEQECEQYRSALGKRKLFRIMTAVGTVGAAVGAVIMNGRASDAYDTYMAEVAPERISSAWDDYESRYRMRNILIGVAGVFLATEVYFTLKKPKAPPGDCDEMLMDTSGPELGLGVSGDRVFVALRVRGL